MIALKQGMKSLVKETQVALTSIGLSKQSRSIFVRPINSAVMGVVTLGLFSPMNGVVSINPGAGVRHQPLERLIAELTSSNGPQPHTLVTIGASLGYLMPENTYTTFNFSLNEQFTPALEELAETIKNYGYQWMQTHATLDAILKEIHASYRFIGRDAARLRIPAIYYLKGDFDGARNSIQAGLAEIGTSQGAIADQYRNFADALLQKLIST